MLPYPRTQKVEAPQHPHRMPRLTYGIVKTAPSRIKRERSIGKGKMVCTDIKLDLIDIPQMALFVAT